jgi:hypothetical protein
MDIKNSSKQEQNRLRKLQTLSFYLEEILEYLDHIINLQVSIITTNHVISVENPFLKSDLIYVTTNNDNSGNMVETLRLCAECLTVINYNHDERIFHRRKHQI